MTLMLWQLIIVLQNRRRWAVWESDRRRFYPYRKSLYHFHETNMWRSRVHALEEYSSFGHEGRSESLEPICVFDSYFNRFSKCTWLSFSDGQPENVLCLSRTGNRIKLIDFGLARKFDKTKKLQVLFGTPEFVAPEVVNFDQIAYGTDMWSVGVICYVLWVSFLLTFTSEKTLYSLSLKRPLYYWTLVACLVCHHLWAILTFRRWLT